MNKEELENRFDIIKDMAKSGTELPEDIKADRVDLDFYVRISMLFSAFRNGEKTKTEAIMNGEALRRAYHHEKDIYFRNMEIYSRNQETYKKTGQIRADVMKHGEEMSSGAFTEAIIDFIDGTGDPIFAQKIKDLFDTRFLVKMRKTEDMKKKKKKEAS